MALQRYNDIHNLKKDLFPDTVLARQTVYYAKPSCNYTGQRYEAGENKYPITLNLLLL